MIDLYEPCPAATESNWNSVLETFVLENWNTSNFYTKKRNTKCMTLYQRHPSVFCLSKILCHGRFLFWNPVQIYSDSAYVNTTWNKWTSMKMFKNINIVEKENWAQITIISIFIEMQFANHCDLCFRSLSLLVRNLDFVKGAAAIYPFYLH